MKGYMGRILWVDLTSRTIESQPLADDLCEKFIGGYGIGARILVDRIPAGADPMGSDNVLGIITGPYTATDAIVASRYTVVGKSPLTGGWGDANSGGFFGPTLKHTGVDGVFFTGISDKPVYVLMEESGVRIADASHLWGLDVNETEDRLKAELGSDIRIACIGPAGEKLSRIAAIMNDLYRAAARSGLGAVMGSKKLKAVVVRGKAKVPVADPDRLKQLRSQGMKQIRDGTGFSKFYTDTGTPGYTVIGAESGDSPVKNWKGAATVDYEYPKEFTYEAQEAFVEKKYVCYRCPIACGHTVKIKEGAYAGAGGLIPEYETQSAYASNVVNYDFRSVVKANDLCNRQGLDTISAGATVAFAIECFEAGIISEIDTEGVRLDWGNHESIVKLTEMIAERRAIGDLLAEGPVLAAKKLGKGSEAFAIHAGGSPLPMHDPRFEPTLGVIYKTNATPGRHTQACQYLLAPNHPVKNMPMFGQGTRIQEGRGKFIRVSTAMAHIFNCVGSCLFAYLSTEMNFLIEQLSAITGKEWSFDELVETGERIENVRQAFNWKHGIHPLDVEISERAIGRPPLPAGPTAGMTVEMDKLIAEYFQDMGWDPTGRPSLERLQKLGIAELAPLFA